MTAESADDRPLASRLADRSRRDGPMAVSDFVEAALYDPTEGFYMAGGRAGREGDFLTAPEVGPLFGAVIARAIDLWWEELGSPDPFLVVDLGAGPGTLARTVLAAAPPALEAGALRWASVERSEAQRQLHPVADHVVSLESIPEIDGPVVVLANEVLDNLPFDIIELSDRGWTEVRVTLDDRGEFVTVPGEVTDPDVRLPPTGGLSVGTRVPVQAEASRLLDELVELIPEGRLVVLDYGADTASLASRPDVGWMRTHRRHDDRGDWLSAPGTRDITVDVAIVQISVHHPPTAVSTQAEFLRRHGIEELVEEGRRIWNQRAHLGDLAAMKARSRVSEAEALLDPDGMGGFFVAEWAIRG